MEEVYRLRSSPGGFRAHVTTTYARIADITESPTPVTPAQRITLATSLEIPEEKKIVLIELDMKIIKATQELGQLEEEICKTKEYHAILLQKIAFFHDFMARIHLSPSDPATVYPVTSTESVIMPVIPKHIIQQRMQSPVLMPFNPQIFYHDLKVISTSKCTHKLP